MGLEFDYQKTMNYLDSMSDVRTVHWPFVGTPYVALLCVCCYLLVIMFGPNRMKKRKAMDLKGSMLFYNAFLVLWNAYMFFLFLRHGLFNPGFNLVCDAVDYSNDRSSVMLAWAIYLYYLSKLVELLDTVFFILRKKNNQVSFLHVYHHATMPLLWWLGTKYVGGGESYLSPLVNSFVHVWMYAYYALSAFGPWIQPYLWWKKYITMLQMSQFVIVLTKTIFTILFGCSFPNIYLWGQAIYMFSLLILFLNFYKQAYTPQNKASLKMTTNGTLTNGHVHDTGIRKIK